MVMSVTHLQVTQLEGGRRIANHLRRLAKRSRCLLLSFGGDDFGAGFTGGFCLSGHRALQLHGQAHVLAVRSMEKMRLAGGWDGLADSGNARNSKLKPFLFSQNLLTERKSLGASGKLQFEKIKGRKY